MQYSSVHDLVEYLAKKIRVFKVFWVYDNDPGDDTEMLFMHLNAKVIPIPNTTSLIQPVDKGSIKDNEISLQENCLYTYGSSY
jgi:hypothetical protein